MSKKTFAEIKAILDEKEISTEEVGNQDVDWESLGLGEVIVIDDESGWEGHGEEAYIVYYFKDHDVYMRVNGSYYSHHGTDWEDEPFEVTKKEKTIIVYE